MVRFIFSLFAAVLLSIVLQTPIKAAEEPPINQLQPVDFIIHATRELLEDVKASKQAIEENKHVILEIVDKKIMPYISTRTIARKVMGFKWKIATEQQKTDFTREFTTYLKRFYARAFLSYDNQKLNYTDKPKLKGSKIAIVYTQLLETGKPEVAINYKLYKKKDGSWMMIDIIIEGISLVISNQRQYAGQIKREGLDSVIVKLTYKNQQEFE